MVDPAFWFGDFIRRHAERHPAYPWPDPDSSGFGTLCETWIEHLRTRRVTEAMADKASKALMLVPHWPNNHVAEFFAAMPDPEPEYFAYDRDLVAFYASKAQSVKDRARVAREAKDRRGSEVEARRKATLLQLETYRNRRPVRDGGEVAS